MLKIPSKVPEKGFYYHYKHDPKKGVQDCAYEVLGVGYHTEDNCRLEDVHMVVYRSLYKEPDGGKIYLRPLEMFMENVTKEGRTFPRFNKITDLKIVTLLEKVRDGMYRTK